MTRRHVLIPSKIEYVSHACNYVRGCAHGCRYCYMRRLTRASAQQWRDVQTVPFAASLLRDDLDRLKEPPADILVCSSHDPYQPDMNGLTREVLTVLAEREMPVSILSKGGLRAIADLDLLQRPGARLGVTITTHDERERERWEPGAASIKERFLALVNAKLRDVATWVSVEPILPGLDVELLARQLKGLADWVVVGKWNYSQEAKAMGWVAIRERAVEAFEAVGIPLLVKEELANEEQRTRSHSHEESLPECA